MQPPIVASAGLSCQTAHQLGRLDAQGRVRLVKGPFDWMIAPPDALACWVTDGLPDFRPGDIVIDRRPDGSRRAFWPAYGLWFWHGFLVGPKGDRHVDIEQSFERELSKLAHQRARLAALDPDAVLFVLSNAQANLDGDVFSDAPPFDDADRFVLAARDVIALHEALGLWLGGPVRMAVVARRDRAGDLARHLPRERLSLFLVAPDASPWKGDDAAWDGVMHDLAAPDFPFR